MDKKYLARLDKAEEIRVKDMVKGLDPEDVDIKHFFRSDVVQKTVDKGGEALIVGYNACALPTVALFHERILLETCVLCKCVREPKLLEPYLERDLVIPILRSPYSNYPTAFVEALTRYPHISAAEYDIFRQTKLLRGKTRFVCPHCANKIRERCRSSVERLPIESAARISLGVLLDSALGMLAPFAHPDYFFLYELENCLKENDLKGFQQVLSLMDCVGEFRMAQVYSAIPQVSIENLEAIEEAVRRSPDLGIGYDITEIRDFVMRGLKLSYVPSVPLDTYLDIVVPRRRKIQAIVTDIIRRSQPTNKVFLSNMQREIEKVNSEVQSLRSSKKAKLWNLATNFVVENRSIIAACIIGAGLGSTEFGMIGCGGGLLVGAGAKLLGKYARISIPKEAKEIGEVLRRTFEPGYERLLAHYLSKNVNIVQVWQLQEKIQAK